MLHHAAKWQVEVLMDKALMHVIVLVKRHPGGSQQGVAVYPLGKILISKRRAGNTKEINPTQIIGNTAWHRGRLHADRPDHFTTTKLV